MKMRILVFGLLATIVGQRSKAQNVFNPNDSIVRWNPSQPYGSAQNPRSSTTGLQKWVSVETDGISTGYSAFDGSSFKSYFLRLGGKSVTFRMKYPRSYGSPDSAAKRYPLMVFFHGAGEPACAQNGGIYNNEKHLIYGANYFRGQVDDNKYDGFLLYPQIYTTNAGCFASSWSTDHYFPLIISFIDSLVKYARVDIDRIVADGLSSGGVAAWKIAELYPQRIAATAPTSAVGGSGTNYSKLVHIPIWLATGGVDNNPSPSTAQSAVNAIRNLGGSVRHTIYPDQGHFVWEFHWREPGFIDFLTQAHKANPLVFFQKSQFCPDSMIRVKLGITPGYYAYEWRKDSILIAQSQNGIHNVVDTSAVFSFNGNEIQVREFGTYQVRFKRSNISEWSVWSPTPAVIQPKQITQTPNIASASMQSTVLPAPDGATTVQLRLPDGFTSYQWMRLSDSTIVGTASTYLAPPGDYVARYAEPFGCGSEFSPVFHVADALGNTPPDSARDFTAQATSANSILLRWTDNFEPLINETMYEIYRSSTPGGAYELIALLPANVASYLDSGLQTNRTLYYRLRGIHPGGASLLQKEAVAKTWLDRTAPAAPRNLRYMGGSNNTVSLRWNASTDDVAVAYYSIFVDGKKLYSSRDTVFTVPYLDSTTTHRFWVTATDAAGNVSAAGNTVQGKTQQQGVYYKYYHGNWDGLPDFNTLTPVKAGEMNSPGLQSGIRTQSDYFAFLWEGYLLIPDSGVYTFELVSDDGSRMYIDTFYDPSLTPFIDNNWLHPAQSRQSTITLSKGYHKVAFSFFEKAGNEVMQLFWSKAGGHAREAVPPSLFSLHPQQLDSDPPAIDSIPPSAPVNLIYRGSNRNSVTLGWQPASDNTGINHYEIYVDGIKRDTTSASTIVVQELDSGRVYRFAVRGVDHAGNRSLFSNQVTAFTHKQGVMYFYYEGSWSLLPLFDSMIAVRQGLTDSASLGLRLRDDDFAFLWQGYLYIPETGSYTFELISDDGSKLYIGNGYSDTATALIDNDGLHGAEARTGSILLSKGYHPFALTFFERAGDATVQLNWTAPGRTKEGIPKDFFTPYNYTLSPPPGAPDSLITEATSTQVRLAWIDKSENESGFEIDRSDVDSLHYRPIHQGNENDTFYVDTLVNQNTRYYYRLRAIGPTGESAFISASDITAINPPAIAAPINVTARIHANETVTLTWDRVSDLDSGYKIWRRADSASSFILLDSVPGQINGWTDVGVDPGTYAYFIRACSDTVESVASDTVMAIVGNLAPLIVLPATNLYLKTDSLVHMNFSVSDAEHDSVYVELPGRPAFCSLLKISPANYRLSFKPEFSDIGWYTLTIQATDRNGGSSVKSVAIFNNDKNTRSVYVRFGHSSIPAPKPWNNFTGTIPANTTRANLKDEKNATTPFSITMVDAWATLTSLCFNTGNNSGAFPDTILARGLREASATRKIIVGGLNRNMQYNLVFLGSVNEGVYAANSYSCGTQKDTLIIRYNSNETGNLNNLVPDSSGQLIINVNRLPGTPFIYLNAIVIEEYASTITMLNPSNLHAEAAGSNVIQLSWSDRTIHENQVDGYELQRAEDSAFVSGLQVIALPRNTTSYRDIQLMAGRKYYYRVRTKRTGAPSSGFSNSVYCSTPSTAIFVNFNHNVPPAGAPWNNTAAGPNFNIRFPPLLNQEGENTGIVIKIDKTFNGENNAGMNTGNNSGVVPDNVLRANYWLDKLQVSRLRITGLNLNKKYGFGFIGSIGPNGWVPNNYTATYTINGRTVYLNSWQNTSKIVYINDVSPDEFGEVLVTFSSTKDAAYGFNAGMLIFEYRPDDSSYIPSLLAPRTAHTAETTAGGPTAKGVNVYPNPLRDQLVIELYNEQAQTIWLAEVHDLLGKRVLVKQFTVAQGKQQFVLNTAALRKQPETLLVLTLKANGKMVYTEKLLNDKTD
jgi:chitodextrinase/dienelactone hydrolase